MISLDSAGVSVFQVLTRKTAKGIPRYRDYDADLKKRDVFILRAEDLVPVNDSDLDPKIATQYRPRTEGLFAESSTIMTQNKTEYWGIYAAKMG